MTLLIASLFLPSTIEFDNDADGTRTPDRRPSATRRPSTKFVGTPPTEAEPESANGSTSRRRRTIVDGAGANDTAIARGGFNANAGAVRSNGMGESSRSSAEQNINATEHVNGNSRAPAEASTSVSVPTIDGAMSGPSSSNASETQLPIKRNAKSFDCLVAQGLGRSLTGSGSTTSLKSMTAAEPQASVWGKGTRPTQPQSKAKAPPPQYIAQAKPADALNIGQNILAGPPADALADALDENLSIQRKQTFSKIPWTIKRTDRGNRGLYDAINAAAGQDGLKDTTWVGTTGIPTSELEDDVKGAISEKLEHENDCLAVMVNDSEFDGAYMRYCKTILWPVLHYQVESGPSTVKYHQHSWDAYVKVNEAFTKRILQAYRQGDTVWIHDYHLMLVPDMVRKVLPDAKIGFFMHVAFPSSEVFKCIAMREALLRGVLGANMIGFQIDQYAEHFRSTACRLLGAEAIPEGVQLESRYVNIVSIPIGVDPWFIDEIRKDTEVEEWGTSIREKYGKKRIIAARDPIDQKAGMLKKLRVYRKFLQSYPEWWDHVVFIQIATPTTDTQDPAIAQMVTEINSTYTNLTGDAPLLFLKQDFAYSQWLALLSVADCMLQTSLREGMNLSAHEFVQCQDGRLGAGKHSPLILSEFSGAATIFGKDDALHVNPWYAQQCAQRINEALLMKEDKKEDRWRNNHAALEENTGTKWCDTFLTKLDQVCLDHAQRARLKIPRLSTPSVLRKYEEAKCRLFILDFEGTLASWVSPITMSQFAPKTLIALKNLADDPRNIVYIASSRAPKDLLPLSRQVPGIGLIAENGCFIHECGAEYVSAKMPWTCLIDEAACDVWKESIRRPMEFNTSRGDGLQCIERLSHYLIYCPKGVDFERARKALAESRDNLTGLCHGRNGNVFIQRDEVVVPFSKTTKATAAARILAKLKLAGRHPDFVLVAGDDRDQEPAFIWANKLVTTGNVREAVTILLNQDRNTEASATVNGIAGMVAVLSSLGAVR